MQAQSEDRRCHSCVIPLEVPTIQSVQKIVCRRACVDEATDFNDRDNAGVIVNVQGDEGFGDHVTTNATDSGVAHSRTAPGDVRVRLASERICRAPGHTISRLDAKHVEDAKVVLEYREAHLQSESQTVNQIEQSW